MSPFPDPRHGAGDGHPADAAALAGAGRGRRGGGRGPAACSGGPTRSNYPLVISGKPLFSLPANIPIIFELIVLFAALAAFGGALVLNRLPQFWHPAFGGGQFAWVTTDGFFIFVDAADRNYDEAALRRLAESLGAAGVETCFEATAGRAFPKATVWIALVAILLSTLPVLVDRAVAALEIAHAAAGHLFRHGFPAQVQRRRRPAGCLPTGGRCGRPCPAPSAGVDWRPTSISTAARSAASMPPPSPCPRPRDDGPRAGAIQHLLRRPATAGSARATARPPSGRPSTATRRRSRPAASRPG